MAPKSEAETRFVLIVESGFSKEAIKLFTLDNTEVRIVPTNPNGNVSKIFFKSFSRVANVLLNIGNSP